MIDGLKRKGCQDRRLQLVLRARFDLRESRMPKRLLKEP